MKASTLLEFSLFGLTTVLFRRKKPILGTIIVTDRCNLRCKHCSVNNLTAIIHPYAQVKAEMEQLYAMGVRILFFCGGETFLWKDSGKTIRDLVREAKEMGFRIVNIAMGDVNGTYEQIIIAALSTEPPVIEKTTTINPMIKRKVTGSTEVLISSSLDAVDPIAPKRNA